MLIRSISAALFAATAVRGFRGASPFFLLSTEPLDPASLHDEQIFSAHHVRERVLDALTDSAAALYVFVEQPGVSAADLRDGSTMPHLGHRMRSADYQSVVRIPEVIGSVNTESIASQLSHRRGIELSDLRDYVNRAERSGNAVLTAVESSLAHARGAARQSMLQSHDATLQQQLSSILANTSHVLIYTSSPPPAPNDHDDTESASHRAYQMDEPLSETVMHTDLKRDLGAVHPRQNEDPQAGLPLFEKYQFLSPAIFMGLSVSVLLLTILGVGLSAISGLQVSYMAFSKEMGPQAQQRGKQQ